MSSAFFFVFEILADQLRHVVGQLSVILDRPSSSCFKRRWTHHGQSMQMLDGFDLLEVSCDIDPNGVEFVESN